MWYVNVYNIYWNGENRKEKKTGRCIQITQLHVNTVNSFDNPPTPIFTHFHIPIIFHWKEINIIINIWRIQFRHINMIIVIYVLINKQFSNGWKQMRHSQLLLVFSVVFFFSLFILVFFLVHFVPLFLLFVYFLSICACYSMCMCDWFPLFEVFLVVFFSFNFVVAARFALFYAWVFFSFVQFQLCMWIWTISFFLFDLVYSMYVIF